MLLSSRRRRQRKNYCEFSRILFHLGKTEFDLQKRILTKQQPLDRVLLSYRHVAQRRGAKGRQRQRGRIRNVQDGEVEQKSGEVPQSEPAKPEAAAAAAEAEGLCAANAQGDVATAAAAAWCSWQLQEGQARRDQGQPYLFLL